MISLEVHLYGIHIGNLDGDSWRDFDFNATSVGLETFGADSTIISEPVPPLSLPPPEKHAVAEISLTSLYLKTCIGQRHSRTPSCLWQGHGGRNVYTVTHQHT
jgi:hypothetical protein